MESKLDVCPLSLFRTLRPPEPGLASLIGLLFLFFAASVLAQPRPAQAQASAASSGPRLRITEVFTDPLLLDDRAGEFVEIANIGPIPVPLAALTLVVPSGKTLKFRAPASRMLQPGAVLVLCALGNRPASLALVGLRLPDRAGRIELRWRGHLMDVAHWTRRWPWPKAMAGRSLERRGAQTDGTLGRSWRRSRVPMFGLERGSPGRVSWLPAPKGSGSRDAR